MKVQFIRDTDEEREGAAHKTGDVLDLSPASAERWIRRSAAVGYPLPEPPKLRLNRPMMGATMLEEKKFSPEDVVQFEAPDFEKPEAVVFKAEPEPEAKPRRGRPRKADA